jgi:predicted secreted protein
VKNDAKKLMACIKKLVDRGEPWKDKMQVLIETAEAEGQETELQEFLDWFSEGY